MTAVAEVIAYSATGDHAVAERFRRAGASAYIDKADTAGLFAELRRRLTRAAISA